MGIPERSRERVEEYIAGLEEAYGSVPVNQTTVSLPAERYDAVRECEREMGGFVDVYAQVHNAEWGVLHVGRDADLPGVRVAIDESPEARVRQAVREQAGVECTIERVERATIAGTRNGDDPDCGTLYHVVLVFSGRHTAGRPDANAVWQSSPSTVQVLAR